MFLSHYAAFLVTSGSHDFEDYVGSALYTVLSLILYRVKSAAERSFSFIVFPRSEMLLENLIYEC